MIYTCTLNPSLDYYLEFEQPIVKGATNRSSYDGFRAGGKGINVSIMLNNLQIPSRALGFLGGFTKDYYIQLMQKYPKIQPSFTYVEGNTRINIKLHDGQNTDLNVKGPAVTDANFSNLSMKASRLDDRDFFVFAGNLIAGTKEKVIEMLKETIANEVKVVLDTDTEVIKAVAPCSPFLVKLTQTELAKYAGREILDREQTILEAKAMHREGVRHVMIILDDRSQAIMVCDKGVYVSNIIREEAPLSTVGAGDSMTAGFITEYIVTRDPEESFRFAASCGSATVYVHGLADKEKIEDFFETSALLKLE